MQSHTGNPAKPLLRALRGEALATPPIWLMRQAGRYLPEYRATREKAGDFLSLCYTPELAAEVTLQPIRRYGFDGAILFADILLLAQALGADLGFVQGEGPRLSTVTRQTDLDRLRPADAVHETLSPVYRTIEILRESLPRQTTLIGFAGAPWTVASYMIAGRGTPDQAPARALMRDEPEVFDQLMGRIAEATVHYLNAQIEAGAEVVKLFDSWAGVLDDASFARYVLTPTRAIIAGLKANHPDVPVIVFPRLAGERYRGFARDTGAEGLALDTDVSAEWAAQALGDEDVCLQGNLDPALLVEGGPRLAAEARRIIEAFAGLPHIFNLGHGITPDADPDNVALLVDTVRSDARASSPIL